MYKCINRECRKELSINDLDNVQGIKCPYCGGRVLIKLRPKQAKRVGCI
ncbi:MAG: DNA-directed RNA polymerase subunit P [Candidatus Methanofastidiosa archaeon]|nr:DNA-directed RNA polymerase subunit P [Candidatus Methanofastidiosa archaeon]